MSKQLTPRQFAVKAIHEDKLNLRNPSILAKLLNDYASTQSTKEVTKENIISESKKWSTDTQRMMDFRQGMFRYRDISGSQKTAGSELKNWQNNQKKKRMHWKPTNREKEVM